MKQMAWKLLQNDKIPTDIESEYSTTKTKYDVQGHSFIFVGLHFILSNFKVWQWGGEGEYK